MPRVRRWRDLLPGLLFLAALTLSVLAVLAFARIGALRGETMRLVVLAGSVRDVLAGSEVWIAGQRVGVVREIVHRAPSTDTAFRLALTLDVLVQARPQLREGTRAQIKSGGSLLGAPIVDLAGGTPGGRLLEDGDTVRALPQLDPTSLASSFSGVSTQIPALRENIAAILTQLKQADGSLGAVVREEGFVGAGELGASFRGLARQARSDGTVGRLLAPEGVARQRIARALARADTLRQLMSSPTGTVGRFRRDSTLAHQITAVRDEISIVRALVDQPAGTAGRLVHDERLARELAALEAELALLVADVKAHPLRYLVF